MTAALLYAATAALCLWLAHRFLAPLSRRVAILLALFPLLFTGPALLTGRVYAPVDLPFSAAPLKVIGPQYGIEDEHNGTLADVYTQIIPWKKVVREAWRGGELPLWNPYLFAGDILAGAAQAAPYEPVFLLSLLAPMATSLTFHATVVLFLGGLLMFAWLRELGCPDDASLFGAAAWMFGDFMVFWLEWPLGATWRWLPLVFLGVRRVVRERSPGATALLAIALALTILAGHPESVLHIVALGAAYGLWELSVVAPRRLGRVIARAVLAGILSLAATAVFLLPILEAIPQTIQHVQRKNLAEIDRSAPPRIAAEQLLANVVPFRWGWAKDGQIAEGAPVHPVPWTSYAGSVAIPLAIFGLVRSRRRERRLMLGLLVFGLLAGVNAPPVADVLARLPLFDIAINDRFIAAALFALATLAALGAEAWLERERDVTMTRIAIATTGVLAASVAILWPFMRDGGLSAGFLARESALFLVPLVLALVVLAAVRAPAVALPLLLFLLLGQRALEIGDEYPTLPAEAFYPEFEGLDLLRGDGTPHRVVGLNYTLLPQGAAMYGLEDVRGYQAMTHARFWHTIPFYSFDQLGFNPVPDLSRPFLSFLNVRYAIAEPGVRARSGWTIALETEGMTVLENPRVLPRAYVPPLVRLNLPETEVLEEMRFESDFARRAWIDHRGGGAPPGEIRNGPGRVTILPKGLSRFELRADMEAPAWVVVSEVFWHGWRAYENGRRIPLREANLAFLAMHLDAGVHEIELRYLPLSFLWGAGISIATVVFAIAFAFLRRRRGAAAVPSEEEGSMESRRRVLAIVWIVVALVAVLAVLGWLRSMREAAEAPPPAEPVEQGSGEVETFLFPILIGPEPLRVGDREWKTMVIASSRHDEAFFVGFEDQPIAIVPGTSRPREFSRTALSGARALGPKERAADVTFDLLLRDEATGAIVSVPVHRGSELTAGSLTIAGLSPGRRSRTLRIFDAVRTGGGRVAVTAMRDGEALGEKTVDLAHVETIGPTFAEIDLEELGVTDGANVTIELEALTPNMQLWAMVVETDETGMIRILPPAGASDDSGTQNAETEK